MTIDVEKIKLIKPISYLHSKEKYFPINLEKYLNNVNIKKNNEEPFKLDWKNNNNYTGTNDDKFELQPINGNNNSVFRGNPDINEVKYIVKVNEIEDNTKYQIIFFFFYGYNGETRILHNLVKIGKHYCDIENIYIICNKKLLDESDDNESARKSIEKIYFSAHSGVRVMDPKVCEFEDNRPVVYIANRSHASYPKPGLYFRIFGFGNDYTEKNYKWDPEIIIINNNNDDPLLNFINNYNGNMGFGHVNSFINKSYYNGKLEINKPQGIYINKIFYNIILFLITSIVLFFLGREYFLHGIDLKLILLCLFFIIFYSLDTVYIL